MRKRGGDKSDASQAAQSSFGGTKKPCSTYLRNGKCKFGEGCRFSHGDGGGTDGRSKQTAGGSNAVRNDTKKPCTNYMGTGKCKFGEGCRFSHGGGADGSGGGGGGRQAKQQRQQPMHQAQQIWTPNQADTTSLSAAGVHQKSSPKQQQKGGAANKELCKNWSKKRNCQYGDKCRYLHDGSSSSAQQQRQPQKQQQQQSVVAAAANDYDYLIEKKKGIIQNNKVQGGGNFDDQDDGGGNYDDDGGGGGGGGGGGNYDDYDDGGNYNDYDDSGNYDDYDDGGNYDDQDNDDDHGEDSSSSAGFIWTPQKKDKKKTAKKTVKTPAVKKNKVNLPSGMSPDDAAMFMAAGHPRSFGGGDGKAGYNDFDEDPAMTSSALNRGKQNKKRNAQSAMSSSSSSSSSSTSIPLGMSAEDAALYMAAVKPRAFGGGPAKRSSSQRSLGTNLPAKPPARKPYNTDAEALRKRKAALIKNDAQMSNIHAPMAVSSSSSYQKKSPKKKKAAKKPTKHKPFKAYTPSRPGQLNTSQFLVGACPTMMPQEEIATNIKNGEVVPLEKEHPSRPGWKLVQMCIKKFRKSSSDGDDENRGSKENVRPPHVLHAAWEYMKEHVLDHDGIDDPRAATRSFPNRTSFPAYDIEGYVRDRTKQINKDWSLQGFGESSIPILLHPTCISQLEQITRWVVVVFLLCSFDLND